MTSQQISLPGLEPAPAALDRLFFAVLPQAPAAERMVHLAAHLRQVHGLQGKVLQQARLHVSLHGLGDHAGVPHALLARASQAAAAVAQPPFAAVLDRALSFSGRSVPGRERPMVLCGEGAGVSGLLSLHQALAAALHKTGIAAVATTGFTPHVTLLYDTQSVAEHPVEPVEWTVREFVLVHSRIGQRQPYIVLGRWPLQD